MVAGSYIPSHSDMDMILITSLFHFERSSVSLFENLGNLVDAGPVPDQIVVWLMS